MDNLESIIAQLVRPTPNKLWKQWLDLCDNRMNDVIGHGGERGGGFWLVEDQEMISITHDDASSLSSSTLCILHTYPFIAGGSDAWGKGSCWEFQTTSSVEPAAATDYSDDPPNPMHALRAWWMALVDELFCCWLARLEQHKKMLFVVCSPWINAACSFRLLSSHRTRDYNCEENRGKRRCALVVIARLDYRRPILINTTRCPCARNY